MSRKGASLLRDLSVLLRRYPSPQWARLAKLLEQRRTRLQLIQFLRELSEERSAAETRVRKKKPGNVEFKPSPQGAMAKDKRSEWLELELSRQTIAALRDLLKTRGLPFSPKDSKRRLIDKLVKSSLKTGDRMVIRSTGLREDDSSDYAQWAEIIMGRNKKQALR